MIIRAAITFGRAVRLIGMTLPPDLSVILDGETRLFFESLSQRRKRTYVERIVQARRPETRERRIATAVQMLRAERRR